MPDGSTATRDVVVHPGAVGIIALDDAGQVLLIEQYRHPVGRLLWEPPAGLLDEPGEDPLVAAQRELDEEAHLQARAGRCCSTSSPRPGCRDEAVRIYLARESARPRRPGSPASTRRPTCRVVGAARRGRARAAQRGDLHNPLAVMGVLAAAAAAQEAFAGLRPADAPWPDASAFTGSAATRR